MRPDASTISPLVLIAALFTLFDAAATWTWLQLGFAEGNPVVRASVELLGPTQGMLLRASWGVLLLVGLAFLARHHLLARTALVGITLAMAMVGMVHVAGGTNTFLALV